MSLRKIGNEINLLFLRLISQKMIKTQRLAVFLHSFYEL